MSHKFFFHKVLKLCLSHSVSVLPETLFCEWFAIEVKVYIVPTWKPMVTAPQTQSFTH